MTGDDCYEGFLRYSSGSFEGVRIRRVKVGEVGCVSASFMNARPLAPGLCLLVGWFLIDLRVWFD